LTIANYDEPSDRLLFMLMTPYFILCIDATILYDVTFIFSFVLMLHPVCE